jgi:hypothetical protein
MGGERRAQNVKDGDTGRARKTRQEKDEDKPCWPHVLADVTVPLLPGIPDSGSRFKTRPPVLVRVFRKAGFFSG